MSTGIWSMGLRFHPDDGEIAETAAELEELGCDTLWFRGGGSDRPVDAVVAWGDEDAMAQRLAEHRDGGADHVCWQVIHDGDGLPREQWRQLAEL